MNIAVVCTGNELLRGTTVNTNLTFLGSRLTAIGLPPVLALTVGDNLEQLLDALAIAFRHADWVISSGGLGSTCDDLSRDAAAAFCHCELQRQPALAEQLRRYWRQRHPDEEMPDYFLRQADVPSGGVVLPNPDGSAPGIRLAFRLAGREKVLILLPGPPAELEAVFVEHVLPQLPDAGRVPPVKQFTVAGGAEILVQQKMQPLLAGRHVGLALCASVEGTRVFLSGRDADELEQVFEAARNLFGDQVLQGGGLELIPEVVALLRQRGLTLVTAESCTGGRIAGAVTDYAGVSDLFKGGIVAYSNAVKERLLRVDPEILRRHGAVSAECAGAMVRGVCRVMSADCAVAVTGIAGPGGGTAEKPVGLVYVAAKVGEAVAVRECRFRGGRRQIRLQTQAQALLLLRELLLGRERNGGISFEN